MKIHLLRSISIPLLTLKPAIQVFLDRDYSSQSEPRHKVKMKTLNRLVHVNQFCFAFNTACLCKEEKHEFTLWFQVVPVM